MDSTLRHTCVYVEDDAHSVENGDDQDLYCASVDHREPTGSDNTHDAFEKRSVAPIGMSQVECNLTAENCSACVTLSCSAWIKRTHRRRS